MVQRSWKLVVLLLAVLLAGCARTLPEQALRERIEAMQVAVEAREPGEFLDAVAADFIGRGGLDRRQLGNLLRAQMLRNADIGVTLGPVAIDVHGATATASFGAVITGGRGGLIPERARAYGIETGWRLEDGEWTLVTADWKERL